MPNCIHNFQVFINLICAPKTDLMNRKRTFQEQLRRITFPRAKQEFVKKRREYISMRVKKGYVETHFDSASAIYIFAYESCGKKLTSLSS